MIEKIKIYYRLLIDNIELIIPPIIFLLLLLLIRFLWAYFGLPTQEETIVILKEYFAVYGLWIILVSSILESILFVGWYFPGSLVIFLGVSATYGNPILAVKTVALICLGMVIGYSINYLLGRYGWHKLLLKVGFNDELERIKSKVENKGLFDTFVLYIMPGFGSILSTAIGVLKIHYTKFLAFTVISVLAWNAVWGVLVYYYGMPLFNLLLNPFVMFLTFTAYLIYAYKTKPELYAR